MNCGSRVSTMNRKRQFYPNPFSPLTPDSAWALGLWYADGCLSGDGKHAIMMQKEVVLLEQMKAIIAPPDNPERVRIRHCGGATGCLEADRYVS
jgi:hypothetical protein